jgi:Uma2 family endonuclease
MALSAQTPTPRPATLDDFLTISPSERFHEILNGELVRKTMPSAKHGAAQLRLGMLLAPYDESGLRQPGGWWLMSEVEIVIPGRQPLRPDLVGWRAERMHELPEEFPVALRPDWVCEIVSPGDERRDTVIKYRDYARAGIPHYWMVDLAAQRLTSLRLVNEHYDVQTEGRAGQAIRAQPFELIEIAVGVLFGTGRVKTAADA